MKLQTLSLSLSLSTFKSFKFEVHHFSAVTLLKSHFSLLLTHLEY